MDKGFKGRDLKSKGEQAVTRKKPNVIKKTVSKLWRFVCNKRKLLFDVAVFTAAAATIYIVGDRISKAFIEQLPNEDLLKEQLASQSQVIDTDLP